MSLFPPVPAFSLDSATIPDMNEEFASVVTGVDGAIDEMVVCLMGLEGRYVRSHG